MSATRTAKEPKTGKFKKGDLVRVVTPLVFVRCGYPLDPAAQRELFAKEFAERIYKFLDIDAQDAPHSSREWASFAAFQKAASALTTQWLHTNGFGGNERKIYAEEASEIKGRVFKVAGWHFNKTGDYFAPCHTPASWDSPEEYELGGLDNVVTHRILHLESVEGPYKAVKIEACHVEKIEAANV
jgi:hypothetical protein